GGGRVLRRTLVDTPVRFLDQRLDGVLAAAAVSRLLAQGLRGELRRHLARLRAAHAVDDREDRGFEDIGVLVVPALAARVGDSGGAAEAHSAHGSNLRSVSPMRTTSPAA